MGTIHLVLYKRSINIISTLPCYKGWEIEFFLDNQMWRLFELHNGVTLFSDFLNATEQNNTNEWECYGITYYVLWYYGALLTITKLNQGLWTTTPTLIQYLTDGRVFGAPEM